MIFILSIHLRISFKIYKTFMINLLTFYFYRVYYIYINKILGGIMFTIEKINSFFFFFFHGDKYKVIKKISEFKFVD